MSLTSLVITASEAASDEPAIHPYAVGAIALGILLAALAILLILGGGREHS